MRHVSTSVPPGQSKGEGASSSSSSSSKSAAQSATTTAMTGEVTGGLDAVRRAWTFLWDPAEPQLRWRIGAAFALMIGAKLTAIQVPFIFKLAIDALSDPVTAAAVISPIPSATMLALTPASLLLLYGVTRATADGMQQLRNALFARVAEGALRRMARRTFTHLHSLELRFHLDRQTGALTRVVERGTRAVGSLLSMSVLQVVPLIFEVTVVSVLLARNCGPQFVAVTLTTLGLYCGFTFMVTAAREKVRKMQNRADNEASQKFTDSMLNYETVKYFDATPHEERRYDAALEKYMGAAIHTQLTLAGLNFGQAAILSGGLGVAMMLAATEVTAGRMSVGDVVMVQGLIFQLAQPLGILGFVYNSVRQATTDMGALIKLQQTQPLIASLPNAPPLILNGGGVTFDNVSFGYGDVAPSTKMNTAASGSTAANGSLADAPSPSPHGLLKGVSFTVEPGQTVAIVGGSGSGKSTILRLLYRFYDPSHGSISIDGQDIRSVELDSVRRALGVVPQDVVLFNDTIMYNLQYGRLDATVEEVERAAQHAQIHEAITRMPNGYDTIVGERGLKLSGGEKQRIAIGRALLRDPPILLCDEATSAVDTVTEHQIFADLRALSSGRRDTRRTCLMIAHRLSTVVDADKILVLQKGRVVESGTHADLVALGGEYAMLWAMQLSGADHTTEDAPVDTSFAK